MVSCSFMCLNCVMTSCSFLFFVCPLQFCINTGNQIICSIQRVPQTMWQWKRRWRLLPVRASVVWMWVWPMTWSVNRRRPSLSVSHGPPDLMSPSPPPLEWWLLLMMMVRNTYLWSSFCCLYFFPSLSLISPLDFLSLSSYSHVFCVFCHNKLFMRYR